MTHLINHNELKIYNDETYYDDDYSGDATFIDSSAKSDKVPLTTNPNILKKIKGINKSINYAKNYDDNNLYIYILMQLVMQIISCLKIMGILIYLTIIIPILKMNLNIN